MHESVEDGSFFFQKNKALSPKQAVLFLVILEALFLSVI